MTAPHLIDALAELDAAEQYDPAADIDGDTAEPVDEGPTFRPVGKGEQPTHLLIEFDGGREVIVRRTNRDLIAWDKRRMHVKYGPATEAPFIFAAFLAWNAARREGEFDGPFDGPGGFTAAADDITGLCLAGTEAGEGEAGPTRRAARLG